MHPMTKETSSFHNIVKNLDYMLRVKQAKSIVVASDDDHEGKSFFIRESVPLLCDLYHKKVLVFDCQTERSDHLEMVFAPEKSEHQFIRATSTKGLDYIHFEDLAFLDNLPMPEKMSSLISYFNEMSRNYDLVLINMKTLRRSEKTILPPLPMDGAILVRSKKSNGSKKRFITQELLDREIPILGIVLNEGP